MWGSAWAGAAPYPAPAPPPPPSHPYYQPAMPGMMAMPGMAGPAMGHQAGMPPSVTRVTIQPAYPSMPPGMPPVMTGPPNAIYPSTMPPVGVPSRRVYPQPQSRPGYAYPPYVSQVPAPQFPPAVPPVMPAQYPAPALPAPDYVNPYQELPLEPDDFDGYPEPDPPPGVEEYSRYLMDDDEIGVLRKDGYYTKIIEGDPYSINDEVITRNKGDPHRKWREVKVKKMDEKERDRRIQEDDRLRELFEDPYAKYFSERNRPRRRPIRDTGYIYGQ